MVRASPEELRGPGSRSTGGPPGELYVDGGEIVVSGLAFGNVFIGIQPPRGFGENPIAIYHDPDLPPTHHYLAVYWWIIEEFGADAIVHLGKHGTLEWLPGKSLGLSSACSPDAALRDVPLFYPFVVNDPGEGTQAKRRAHAVVVDHLIPPMTRAETYDDLARLEQLLDEYYQVETLDPSKLPAIRARIWETLRDAELHRDLGVEEQPEEFGDFLNHVDGYLCEIKDLPIRGGLHTLGKPPEGEPMRHLLAAILRLGAGDVPACAGPSEQPSASTSASSPRTAAPGWWPRSSSSPASRRGRNGFGPDRPSGRATQTSSSRWRSAAGKRRRLKRSARRFWVSLTRASRSRCASPPRRSWCASLARRRRWGTCWAVFRGLRPGWTVRVADARAGERAAHRPQLLLRGPKALPSRLSWEVGQGLADGLLRRYLEEEGRFPETVGIVVWGTAAMRTQGDDVAEILALLGVRPIWNEESLRVTGIEIIPPEELGRPG